MQTRRFGHRWFAGPAIALAFVTTGACAADGSELPDLPEAPTLADFQRIAEERNPGLEASRRLWEAEIQGVRSAGSFPDPRLTVGTMLSEVETRVGPQKESVALMQRLPWFGKLGFREEAASAAAEAAGARFAEDRLELRRDVTLAWHDLYWLGRAVALTQESLELLSDMESVVREKYRTSTAGHADLVRIQMELGVLEDRARSLEDRLRPAVARMNALLHRHADATVPLPERLPDVATAPGRERVLETMRQWSPRLRALEHGVEKARAGESLAERSRWPDWMLGMRWIRVGEAIDPTMEGSGRDALMVDVTVELPLFRGKYDGAIREAEERLAVAQSMRAQEEDVLEARAEAILFDWRDADRRAALYGGALLPKAHESWEATASAYRTGRGGFLDLLDAQRMLLDLELENERALTDRGRSAAELAVLTGTEWGKEEQP